MEFKIFDRAFKKKSKSIEGHFDGWNGQEIWGWAIDKKGNNKVELEVLVNEEKQFDIIAGNFRQDLYDAQKNDDGKAGFTAELNVYKIIHKLDLSKDNVVRILHKETKENLIGSPLTIKKPEILGNIDYLDQNSIVGWVKDDVYQNAIIKLDLYVNGELVTEISANDYRQDLSDAGFINPYCGFSVDLTAYVSATEFSKIELRLRGTSEKVISDEWLIQPLPGKVNALTQLQRLIRCEIAKNGIDKNLDWLNSCVVPSLINNVRENGQFSLHLKLNNPVTYSSSDFAQRCIDIIVPVYKGLDETINCINSVREAAVKQPYELIVINDQSPEAELTKILSEKAKAGEFTLLENEVNLGFVGSVNRGMRLHPERDVLLLNSDTLAPDRWLDRIVNAAYSDETIGTVTPFSNNATICSFPKFCVDNDMVDGLSLNEISEMFASENDGLIVDLPTAHGFSMFIKRSVLNEIGYFDEQKWGKGYAEENDFSLRAATRGWRNVLAGDAFVQHLGSVSFAENAESFISKNLEKLNGLYPDYPSNVEDFIHKDPVRQLRNNVAIGVLKREISETKGNQLAKGKGILFISLAFGGGTKVATDDLARLLEDDGQCAFMLTAPEPNKWELNSHKTGVVVQYQWPKEKEQLIQDLKKLDIWHVHFHHTVQFPKEIWKLPSWLGVKYDVTLHDYYTVCPRVNLIDDSQVYCGEPPIGGCERCIEKNGVYDASLIKLKDVGNNVVGWREFHANVLSNARKVIAPSFDTQERINKYIQLENIEAKYHPEPVIQVQPIDFSKDQIINVAFLGAIGPHKGFDVLKKCAEYALKFELPLHFTVIGYTCDDNSLKKFSNITITGKYERNEVAGLIKANNCHIAALFSVWPETFSYTLSEAFNAGLVPLSFDSGAVSERIKKVKFGKCLDSDISIAKICDELVGLQKNSVDTIQAETGCSYKNALLDYYQFQ